MPVGTVDASGVLWNSSSVGKFLCEPAPGMDTIWKMISSAAAKFPTANAVGWRPVLTREWLAEPGSTAKFEKLTLGDYQFIDFATYLKRIEDVASGLVGLTGLERGDFVVIYAETQMEWMLTAMACWRMGLTVVTIYATLGAEGALHGVTQAKCKAVIADAKLLKREPLLSKGDWLPVQANVAPMCVIRFGGLACDWTCACTGWGGEQQEQQKLQ